MAVNYSHNNLELNSPGCQIPFTRKVFIIILNGMNHKKYALQRRRVEKAKQKILPLWFE